MTKLKKKQESKSQLSEETLDAIGQDLDTAKSTDEIDIIEIGTTMHKSILRNVMLAKWDNGKVDKKESKNEKEFVLGLFKHSQHARNFIADQNTAKAYEERVLEEINVRSATNRNRNDNFMLEGIFGGRTHPRQEEEGVDAKIAKGVKDVMD